MPLFRALDYYGRAVNAIAIASFVAGALVMFGLALWGFLQALPLTWSISFALTVVAVVALCIDRVVLAVLKARGYKSPSVLEMEANEAAVQEVLARRRAAIEAQPEGSRFEMIEVSIQEHSSVLVKSGYSSRGAPEPDLCWVTADLHLKVNNNDATDTRIDDIWFDVEGLHPDMSRKYEKDIRGNREIQARNTRYYKLSVSAVYPRVLSVEDLKARARVNVKTLGFPLSVQTLPDHCFDQPAELWDPDQSKIEHLQEQPDLVTGTLAVETFVTALDRLFPRLDPAQEYSLAALRVTNDGRRTIKSLVAKVRCVPLEGAQHSSYSLWLHSKERNAEISPGDMKELLLVYALGKQQEFYPPDTPAEPWKSGLPLQPRHRLTSPLLVEVRFTADDLDQTEWVALRFAMRDVTCHATARLVSDESFSAWRERGIDPKVPL